MRWVAGHNNNNTRRQWRRRLIAIDKIRLGRIATGSCRWWLSKISLRVSRLFRPVTVRQPVRQWYPFSLSLFFSSAAVLFWRPATLTRARARARGHHGIHYLVKKENGLSINVNARPPKRNRKIKRRRCIILDRVLIIHTYIHGCVTHLTHTHTHIVVHRAWGTPRPTDLHSGRTWADNIVFSLFIFYFISFRQIPCRDCSRFLSRCDLAYMRVNMLSVVTNSIRHTVGQRDGGDGGVTGMKRNIA